MAERRAMTIAKNVGSGIGRGVGTAVGKLGFPSFFTVNYDRYSALGEKGTNTAIGSTLILTLAQVYAGLAIFDGDLKRGLIAAGGSKAAEVIAERVVIPLASRRQSQVPVSGHIYGGAV